MQPHELYSIYAAPCMSRVILESSADQSAACCPCHGCTACCQQAGAELANSCHVNAMTCSPTHLPPPIPPPCPQALWSWTLRAASPSSCTRGCTSRPTRGQWPRWACRPPPTTCPHASWRRSWLLSPLTQVRRRSTSDVCCCWLLLLAESIAGDGNLLSCMHGCKVA